MANEIVKQENNRKERRIYTTLDINNDEHVDMLLDTQDKCDYLISDEVGKIIEVVASYVIERDAESVNEETGEISIYNKHVTILFDKEHKSHVTGSNAFYQSYDLIEELKGKPTEENPIKIQIVEREADTKGHNYLKAKYVK